MRLAAAITGLLFMPLSGCVTENAVVANNGQSYAAAPAVPGLPPDGAVRLRTAPTTAEASRIFNKACVDTLPNFAGTPAALTAMGLQIDGNRVFQHPKLDLSIALVAAGSKINCSMIFATTAKVPKVAADAVAARAVEMGKRLFVSQMATVGDRTYLNAQISAQ